MNNIEKKENVFLEGDKEIEAMSLKFIKELIKLYKQKKRSYDHIILTTRRCFCLYYSMRNNNRIKFKSFFWYLLNLRYLREIDEKIRSSQSVDIIGEKFKNCNVLLVDDIMIHGQTVYSYYDKILKYSAKDIDTLVLIRNVERPDYYYIQTKKDYTSIYDKVNWDWRDMSNKIVSYLHNVGQLYVSYVYGFNISKNMLDNVINNKQLIACKEDFSRFIKHPVYSKQCQPKYYYISEYSKYNFIEYAFLRVYPVKNNRKIKYKVLPYIELSDFKSDNIRKVWESIWRGGIPKELESIKLTEDIYKAITAILSFKLCKNLFGENTIVATPEIDKSFVDNFLEIVEQNLCKDPIAVFDELYESVDIKDNYLNNKKTLMELELENIDLSDNTSIFNILETIKQYFYCVSAREESDFYSIIKKDVKEAQVFKEQQIPIATSKFYNLFPDNFKIECLGFMLYLLDNGVASHVVRTFDSGKYVCTSIKAGEQSYHLFSDLLGTALRAVYFLLTYLKKIEELTTINSIKTTFINKLKEIGIKNVRSIEYVLNRPPINLRADYFGILKFRSSCLTPEELQEEEKIISILKGII